MRRLSKRSNCVHQTSAYGLRRRVRRGFRVRPVASLDAEAADVVDRPSARGAVEDDLLQFALGERSGLSGQEVDEIAGEVLEDGFD
jgi:hypothetical protein